MGSGLDIGPECVAEKSPALQNDRPPASPDTAPSLSQSAGNQAIQSASSGGGLAAPAENLLTLFSGPPAPNLDQCRAHEEEPATLPEVPVVVHWNPYLPWVFTVEGSPSPSAVSRELYGFDITSARPFAAVQLPEFLHQSVAGYIADPELMRPVYRERFDQQMQMQLKEDWDKIEQLIFDAVPLSEPIDQTIDILRRWANRGDLRTPSGRSYFDTFLARLRSDYWYRDYLVTSGAHHTYFDSLFDYAGDRAGEVSALISQNSREFGAFRPAWAMVEGALQPREPGKPAQPPASVQVNPDVVKRSADLILDKLEGVTTAGDSHAIADTIVGLPGPEQSRVLQDMMGRYDETKWLGLVGKYGEAWDVGMLYWLFEDLTSDDRDRVQKSLVDNAVLTPEKAAALAGGRGWGGKYLPFTTRKGQEAAQYWADKAVREDSKVAMVMGTFASLWTPETAGSTVATLVGARVFPVVGKISPVLGDTLNVLGTGLASYQTTIALQELVTNKNAYTGEPLAEGERLAHVLNIAANVIFMGVGIVEAGRPTAGRTGKGPLPPGDEQLSLGAGKIGEPAQGQGLSPGASGAPALEPGGSPFAASPGGPKIEWRVVTVNEQTGEITAVGHSGGDYAIVRLNVSTLEGEMIHPASGRVIPIRGGIPVQGEAKLIGPGETSTSGTLDDPAPLSPGAPAQDVPGELKPVGKVPPGGRPTVFRRRPQPGAPKQQPDLILGSDDEGMFDKETREMLSGSRESIDEVPHESGEVDQGFQHVESPDRFDWKMTEEDLREFGIQAFPDLPPEGWEYQPPYQNGQRVRGRLPSRNPAQPNRPAFTQPDWFHPGEPGESGISLEGKNWKLGTDVDEFVFKTSTQAAARQGHLPPNSEQYVVIDIRGQDVPEVLQRQIIDRLVAGSGGALRADHIHFLTGH